VLFARLGEGAATGGGRAGAVNEEATVAGGGPFERAGAGKSTVAERDDPSRTGATTDGESELVK
jgi:hypothetical protein